MNEMNEKDLEKVSGGDNLELFPFQYGVGTRVRHRAGRYEGIVKDHGPFEEGAFEWWCTVQCDDGEERSDMESYFERV